MTTSTDPSAFSPDATPNDAMATDGPVKIEQVGPSEIHALIQHAQFAMWDTNDSGVEIPYCRVKIPGKEILHQFLRLLPQTEEAEHYRRCQTCARAIESMGDWVVANFDGTLDSVLFPAIDIPKEFENEWTELLTKMNRFITQRVSEDELSDGREYQSLPIYATVCRPLDGASYPKSARNSDLQHFGVFTTPRQPQSARTLCKLNDRMFAQAKRVIASKGFNSVNIAGLVEMQGMDHEFTQSVYMAINAASIVLWNVETHGIDDVTRGNILTVACGFAEGLANFPPILLDILDAFEDHGDYEVLIKSIKANGL